ncbi:hypothetical protein [Streptomyces sp. NPDC057702]|uniref:hypothetical protein n=1 Tax=unclassified Streptomyces TaxID=2593676 RepID=UPI0036BE00E3
MATSEGAGHRPAALRYLESRKNLAGCALGLAGLGLYAAGVAGAYWPVVVAGLYGAGALLAPPERVASPAFPGPGEQVEALRADLETLRAYLSGVRTRDRLPDAAERRLDDLVELLSALLDPERGAGEALAGDGETLHRLTRVIRQDTPESVDAYLRTRWWSRLTPGSPSPDEELGRQLGLLVDEASKVATELRDAQAWRQRALTRYYQDRATPDLPGTTDRDRPRDPAEATGTTGAVDVTGTVDVTGAVDATEATSATGVTGAAGGSGAGGARRGPVAGDPRAGEPFAEGARETRPDEGAR